MSTLEQQLVLSLESGRNARMAGYKSGLVNGREAGIMLAAARALELIEDTEVGLTVYGELLKLIER
jgi:hypothetical protein